MPTRPDLRIGSLCTGYGGLDLATEATFGARTTWTADNDPAAAKIINHRFPDARNLGDFTTTDWATVEPVDILTAGWPCQPFSNAGKRKGAADERAIWPEVARAVRALRPRYVVLENVSAITTVRTGPELARATASLAEIGYVGSWLCLRASDVGAPHRRERIFILATDTRSEARDEWPGLRPDESRWVRRGRPGNSDGTTPLLPTPDATHGRKTSRTGPLLAGAVELLPTPTATPYGNNQSASPNAAVRPSLDTLAQLLPTPRATDGTKGAVTRSPTTDRRADDGRANLAEIAVSNLLPTPSVADGLGGHERRGGQRGDELLLAGLVKSERFGQYADAVARWEPIIGRPAPDPTINGRLSPRFVEWMMGIPEGWVTEVPGLTRAQQLKALGNGVVPQQAHAAISHQIGGLP